MRLIGLRFWIRSYVGYYIFFGIYMSMSRLMDLFMSWWNYISIDPIYFRVLLNGSLIHWFCIMCVVTNHHPCVDMQRSTVETCDSNHVVHFFYYSCLLFLASFFFMFPCYPLRGSVLVITLVMRYLNLLRINPWFGSDRKYLLI